MALHGIVHWVRYKASQDAARFVNLVTEIIAVHFWSSPTLLKRLIAAESKALPETLSDRKAIKLNKRLLRVFHVYEKHHVALPGLNEEERNMVEEIERRLSLVKTSVHIAQQRTERQFQDGCAEEVLLVELFGRLLPDEPAENLHTKTWQRLGFQGTHPKTDLRKTGLLALDGLVYFARAVDNAADIVSLAVNMPDAHWYPFALAFIHMTDYVYSLASSHRLDAYFDSLLQNGDLFLEQAASLLGVHHFDSAKCDVLDTPDLCIVWESPILKLITDLMLEFHGLWTQGNSSIMEFESVFQSFKEMYTTPIEDGVIFSLPSSKDD